MPTGYTAALYEGEQSFESFVMTCARAFGALVTMRDEGLGADIPDRFEADGYHVDQLQQAEARLADLQAMSDEDAAHVARQNRAAWDVKRAAEKRTNDAMRDRYEAMRERVLAWRPPTEDHVGLRDFMVQQLDESIKFDCSWHEIEGPTTDGRKWREERIASALHDIEYHAKGLREERARAADRTEWVQSLRRSLEEPVHA